MQKEIKAALAAVQKAGHRNEGDRVEHGLIVTLLIDALMHAERLPELADTCERLDRVREAQRELNAAQDAQRG